MVFNSTHDVSHFNPSESLLHLTGRNWGSSCCGAEMLYGVKPGQCSPKAKECRNLGNTAERMPWGLSHTTLLTHLSWRGAPSFIQKTAWLWCCWKSTPLPLNSNMANSRQFLKLDQKEVQKLSDKMQAAGASLHQSKETNSSCHYWLQDFKPDYRNLLLFITAGRTWVSCSSPQLQFQPLRPLFTPPKHRNYIADDVGHKHRRSKSR